MPWDELLGYDVSGNECWSIMFQRMGEPQNVCHVYGVYHYGMSFGGIALWDESWGYSISFGGIA